MKRGILITGGSGLLSLNWAVKVKDSFRVTLCLHRRSIRMKGVDCRRVSLDTIDSVASAIRETNSIIVINTAAVTNVETCESNPNLARYVNTEIARNVALACKQERVKLVQISTDHLFSGGIPMAAESLPVSPLNIYARTKAEGETVTLDAYHSSLVLRTNFFGWGPTYRKSFSDFIIDKLRAGQAIELFEDTIFTPISMDFLIDAAHELIECDAEGIFHATGEERLSKYEFGLKIASVFNLDQRLIIPSLFVVRRDLTPRPLDLSLDNRKMCSVLGREIGGLAIQFSHLVATEERRRIMPN